MELAGREAERGSALSTSVPSTSAMSLMMETDFIEPSLFFFSLEELRMSTVHALVALELFFCLFFGISADF